MEFPRSHISMRMQSELLDCINLTVRSCVHVWLKCCSQVFNTLSSALRSVCWENMVKGMKEASLIGSRIANTLAIKICISKNIIQCISTTYKLGRRENSIYSSGSQTLHPETESQIVSVGRNTTGHVIGNRSRQYVSGTNHPIKLCMSSLFLSFYSFPPFLTASHSFFVLFPLFAFLLHFL